MMDGKILNILTSFKENPSLINLVENFLKSLEMQSKTNNQKPMRSLSIPTEIGEDYPRYSGNNFRNLDFHLNPKLSNLNINLQPFEMQKLRFGPNLYEEKSSSMNSNAIIKASHPLVGCLCEVCNALKERKLYSVKPDYNIPINSVLQLKGNLLGFYLYFGHQRKLKTEEFMEAEREVGYNILLSGSGSEILIQDDSIVAVFKAIEGKEIGRENRSFSVVSQNIYDQPPKFMYKSHNQNSDKLHYDPGVHSKYRRSSLPVSPSYSGYHQSNIARSPSAYSDSTDSVFCDHHHSRFSFPSEYNGYTTDV